MTDFEEEFRHIFKVVLIGSANVGKTAMIYRYVLDQLPTGLTPTVGVEFTKRIVQEKSTETNVQLHIWDTAGQERYKSVTKHHYRGADACILVFDISCQDSFDEIDQWLQEVRENTQNSTLCLVGNKCDLEPTGLRQVNRTSALEFARKNGLIYKETSSFWPRMTRPGSDGVQGGVDNVFDSIVSEIIGRQSIAEDFSQLRQPRRQGEQLDPQKLLKYHAGEKCLC